VGVVGWTGTHRCLVSPIIPDKSTCLTPIARKAVGLLQ
jgi:hypothetical protein